MSQDVGSAQLMHIILHTFIKPILIHLHNLLIFLSEKEAYQIEPERVL